MCDARRSSGCIGMRLGHPEWPPDKLMEMTVGAAARMEAAPAA
jgi:hypothetical protein